MVRTGRDTGTEGEKHQSAGPPARSHHWPVPALALHAGLSLPRHPLSLLEDLSPVSQYK